jgi:hypothetical protein
MTKPQWRTYSIRINPTTRKAIALQTRVPLTPQEWDRFITWLEEHRTELVEAPNVQPTVR